MSVLYYIVLTLFVLVCLLLIGIILLQSSKSGGLGSALAGNSSLASAFGSQGADKLLVRITAVFASLFMILAIGLNFLSAPTDEEISISQESTIVPPGNQGKVDEIIEDNLNNINEAIDSLK